MLLQPTRSTRTDPLLPGTNLFRSIVSESSAWAARPSEHGTVTGPRVAAHMGRSGPHMLLEGALEGGFGLVSGKFRHGPGRHVRTPKGVGRDRHPDVRQQIHGRAAEPLLDMADEGCSRYVAEPRQLRKRPGPRGLVEHRRSDEHTSELQS